MLSSDSDDSVIYLGTFTGGQRPTEQHETVEEIDEGLDGEELDELPDDYFRSY